MNTKLLLLAASFFLVLSPGYAQDSSTGVSGTAKIPNSPNGGSESFLFAGAGSVMFVASKDGNTFMPLSLMEMPLVHISNRLFLESGV